MATCRLDKLCDGPCCVVAAFTTALNFLACQTVSSDALERKWLVDNDPDCMELHTFAVSVSVCTSGEGVVCTYCSCITWGRCFRSRSIISTMSGSDNEDSQAARSFLALTAKLYNFFISSGFPLGVQYLLLVSRARGIGSF